MHGWNFIGGPDSTHVTDDTYEVTRLYSNLHSKYKDVDSNDLNPNQLEEYDYYQQITSDFLSERREIDQILQNVIGFEQAIMGARQVFNVSSLDSLSSDEIEPDSLDSEHVTQLKGLVKLCDPIILQKTTFLKLRNNSKSVKFWHERRLQPSSYRW